MANFTTADRIGSIGGYIGGIGTILGMLGNGVAPANTTTNNTGTCTCNATCSENMLVNRYEAGLSAEVERLRTEVSLRDANTFTQNRMGELRDYVDRRFTAVEHEICDQKVFNAGVLSNVSCIQGQIAQLYGLTKLVVPAANICPAPTTTTTTTG